MAPWQSNNPAISSQHQDLQRLLQVLDAANRRIDEYAHQVASLSIELKQYRDIICPSCKEKVLFAASLTPPSLNLQVTPTVPTSASTNLSEPTGTTLAPLQPAPPVHIPVVETGSETSSPLALSPTGYGSDSPSEMCSDAFHTASQSIADSPSDVTPALPLSLALSPLDHGFNSIEASESLSFHTPSWSFTDPSNTTPDIPLSPKSTTSVVAVDYNQEINQPLDLSVVNIFTFMARVLCVKFSRDGNYFAVALQHGGIHIYDMITMSKTVLVEHGSSVFYSEAAAWESQTEVWTVRFSPDGKYMATGEESGLIKIWEIKRKRVRAIFDGHTNLTKCIDFSPDGRFLVSASYDDTVRMWCIRDGSSRYLSPPIDRDFNSVAFSPDGQYVAAGSDDGYLRIWYARTRQLLKKWEGHTSLVWSVAFKPNGIGLASGSYDGTSKSWDLSWLQRLSGHMVNDEIQTEAITCGDFASIVTHVSFSPDGRWVVNTADNDSTSRIWDAATGVRICTLEGHTNCVWAADFSPAGHYLVTGAADRRVMLWRYREVDG